MGNFKMSKNILLSAVLFFALPMFGAEDKRSCQQKAGIVGLTTVMTTAAGFALYSTSSRLSGDKYAFGDVILVAQVVCVAGEVARMLCSELRSKKKRYVIR